MPRGRPKGTFKTDANARHPLYRTWRNMRRRCENPKDDNFKWYGGRGIAVCERWQTFRDFAADIGPRPSRAHTIERLDNDGDYDPFNCVWALPLQQQNNRRGMRAITYNGRTQNLSEWARELGIDYNRLWARLNRGASFEEAMCLK